MTQRHIDGYVAFDDVIVIGADLLSDGENEEYDRAIIEMVATLLGGTKDDCEEVSAALRTIHDYLYKPPSTCI